MRSACILSVVLSLAFPPGLSAQPKAAPVATKVAPPPAAAMAPADNHNLHLPAYRAPKTSLPVIDGNPFSPPKAKEEDDMGSLTDEIQVLLNGFVLDDVRGNAVRINGKLLRVGDDFTVQHTFTKKAPAPGGAAALTAAGAASPAATVLKLRLRDVTATYVVCETPGGDRRLVPFKQYSPGSGHPQADIVIGAGVVVSPTGLVLAAVHIDHDDQKQPKRLFAHTTFGRYQLKLIAEDAKLGMALFQIQPPPGVRTNIRFPFAPVATTVAPTGTEVDAVFYDPGSEEIADRASRPERPTYSHAAVLTARARLPASELGWMRIRGRCPAGVMLFDPSHRLQAITVEAQEDSALAVSVPELAFIRSKIPPGITAADLHLEEVIVPIAKPLQYEQPASAPAAAALTVSAP